MSAYLTLTLTATDRRGATATQTVRLDPRTVVLDVATDPPSLNVSLNAELVTAPAQRTVIAGSLNTVTAADQGPYRFTAWSDDGAASHQLRPTQDTSLTARFQDTTTGGQSSSKAAGSPGAAASRGGSSTSPDRDGRAGGRRREAAPGRTGALTVRRAGEPGGRRARRRRHRRARASRPRVRRAASRG